MYSAHHPIKLLRSHDLAVGGFRPTEAIGVVESLADFTAPPQHLQQLGEVRRHAAGIVAGQPLGGRAALRCNEMSATG